MIPLGSEPAERLGDGDHGRVCPRRFDFGAGFDNLNLAVQRLVSQFPRRFLAVSRCRTPDDLTTQRPARSAAMRPPACSSWIAASRAASAW